jgi:tetratricopeptide (TPR) repeat protein
MSYNSLEAKREMIMECRKFYSNDQHTLSLIDEFDRTYRSADAIFWYTKSGFLYRLINAALRTEDNLIVYKFRYFIIDLCLRLEETALNSVSNAKAFYAYRGSRISRTEIAKLQIDSLIATNGFFSSSKHLDVAQRFIGIDPDTGVSPSSGRDDHCQYILFEVCVDLVKSPDIIVSDVSDHSAMADEQEILFSLDTTFIVTNIIFDDQHRVWHIQMITSSEVASLNKEYNKYTLQRTIETTPAISFGYLIGEILSDYPNALKYLHRLLRSKMFDDDDRPGVYYYLANVYNSMGKYEEAITYCQCARLLDRRRLPQTNMTYARTLDLLSAIYLKKEDRARAMYFHKQASAIYYRSLPKNHYIFGFHLNRRAELYWHQGKFEFALDLLRRILTFVKKALPPSYTCEAQALHIIGLVHRSLNNREQAIDSFKQSLRMRGSFQGNDHPCIARTCYELSELFADQNDLSTALDYAQRSLHIRNSKLPRKHAELRQSVELVERLLEQYPTIASSQ